MSSLPRRVAEAFADFGDPGRCRETGLACATAYKTRRCKCERCLAYKSAENQRRPTAQTERQPVVRAPRAPKAPRGTVLARGPQLVRVPDRPVRAPAPARRLSPGLLATYGFGPAMGTTQRPTKAPGRATVRTGGPETKCLNCGVEYRVDATVGPPVCPSCAAPAPARQGVRRSALGTGITPAGDWSSIIRPRRLLGLSCGHVVAATARVGEAVSCAGCGDTIRVVARDLSDAARPAATGRPSRPGRLALTSGAAPAAAENARAGLAPKRASGWSDLTRPQGGLVKALLAERRRAG
jgi:hypothetical protein